MPIRMQDLDIRAKLPELPRTIDLHELSAPTLEDRTPAMQMFAKRMELGELKRAELPYGPVFAGSRGEMHCFLASGGLYLRNAAATAQYKTEERPWTDLQKVSTPNGITYTMGARTAEKLKAEALSWLREGRLFAEQMGPATIELDQWAEMDEKGRVLRAGGGTAMVKVGYSIDGIPVAGAGAKTLVYAEPAGAGAGISGLFHVWRPTGARTKMEMGTLESALAAGLLVDPELALLYKRGQRITITSLRLCYLALPAFEHQRHLFPAFQVEGSTTTRDGFEARFGKFVHAVAAPQYAGAGIFAHYLQPQVEDRAAGAMG